MPRNPITRRTFVQVGTAAAASAMAGGLSADQKKVPASSILNYNPDMEYRPLGRSGIMVSAVALGGHWKRIDKIVPGVFKGRGWLSADLENEGFKKNRAEVVGRCIERGINWIDACTIQEVRAYSAALKGRRDKMYLACSWYQKEMRRKQYRTKKALLKTLDEGLRESGLEYADLWRITMLSRSSRHTRAEVEEMIAALETAKKQGKIRLAGFSSHDRPHIKWMIETYPEVIDAICTPYTAKTKALPKDSLFDTLLKYKVGCFGIKPFSSNSLFKGDSTPDNPHAEEDNRIARLTIRYILANPAITAPIPGMITVQQVDNVAAAVKERRQLDEKEQAELKQAADQMWAKLPPDYRWLRDWEYV